MGSGPARMGTVSRIYMCCMHEYMPWCVPCGRTGLGEVIIVACVVNNRTDNTSDAEVRLTLFIIGLIQSPEVGIHMEAGF